MLKDNSILHLVQGEHHLTKTPTGECDPFPTLQSGEYKAMLSGTNESDFSGLNTKSCSILSVGISA